MTLPLLPNNAMTFTENQHGNEVLEKLLNQREKGRCCDVILHVSENEFSAHRCVLSACSPFFDSLFKAGKTVKEQLNISSEKPEVFPHLLGYMYTGRVLIDTKNVSELLKLADKLLLFKLKEHCAEYLERYLDVRNCLTVFDMAKRFKLESLLHGTENIIATNLSKIISGKEILNVHQVKLETLMSNQVISFTNEQRLLVISNWVAGSLSERHNLLSLLFTWIDWAVIELQYIFLLIEQHALFRDEESLCVLLETLADKGLLTAELLSKFTEIKNKISSDDYNLDSDNFMSYAISTAIDEFHDDFDNIDTIRESYTAPNAHPLPPVPIDFQPKIMRPRKSFINAQEILHSNIDEKLQEEYRKETLLCPPMNMISGVSKQNHPRPESYNQDIKPIVELWDNSLHLDHPKISGQNLFLPSKLEKEVGSSVEARHRYVSYPKPNQRLIETYCYDTWEESGRGPEDAELHGGAWGHQINKQSDRACDSQPFDLTHDANFPSSNHGYQMQSTKQSDEYNFSAPIPLTNEELVQAFPNLYALPSPNRDSIKEITSNNRNQEFVADNTVAGNCEYYQERRTEYSEDIPNNVKILNPIDNVTENISEGNTYNINRSEVLPENPEILQNIPYEDGFNEDEEKRKDRDVDNSRKSNIKKTKGKRKSLKVKLKVRWEQMEITEEKNCDICDHNFPHKEFITHMKSHFPGPKFKCDMCDLVFIRIYPLLNHRISHSSDKKYHCSLCTFKSHRKFNLQEHMTIHTKSRPFSCKICGAGFSRKTILVNHVRKHSIEKPFSCPDCDWKGKTAGHFQSHKKWHTGDLFHCSYDNCDYKSEKKSHMNDHLMSHTKSRTFICEVCNAGFAIKSRLLRHAKKHKIDSVVVCEFCDYSSTRRDALKRHIKGIHKDKIEVGGKSAKSKQALKSFPASPFDITQMPDDPDGSLVIVSELEEDQF